MEFWLFNQFNNNWGQGYEHGWGYVKLLEVILKMKNNFFTLFFYVNSSASAV